VAFSSGTTAQHASLVAQGIGPGDEVIVPTLTFISTAYTVLIAGAVPVFADVRDATIQIDPQDIRARITPHTKAIVAVHWLGHPADMESILSIGAEHGLAIIEDCAHGPGIRLGGRPVGSFGAISCWSLQQAKMITSAGEGGLATTDDDQLAARLRQTRDHGKAKVDKAPSDFIAPYRVTALGNNYRLSEVQAAFARAQLSKAAEFRARRGQAYRALYSQLRKVPGLTLQVHRPDVDLSYYSFVVRFPRTLFSAPVQQINAAMHAEGVVTHPIGLDELCHVHPLFATAAGRATAPAFQFRGAEPVPAYGWGTLPVAEKLAGELLALPMHPALSTQDVDDIVAATRKVATAYRR
jgi:dTDP-4-amino-4,6-dideoxygalactose transaminase